MIPCSIFGALIVLSTFLCVAKICKGRSREDDDNDFSDYPRGHL
jgi:hypothetical protein